MTPRHSRGRQTSICQSAKLAKSEELARSALPRQMTTPSCVKLSLDNNVHRGAPRLWLRRRHPCRISPACSACAHAIAGVPPYKHTHDECQCLWKLELLVAYQGQGLEDVRTYLATSWGAVQTKGCLRYSQ